MRSQENATIGLLAAIVIIVVVAIAFNVPQLIVAHPLWAVVVATLLGGILVNFVSSSSRAR
jgi:hypothetical protein